MLRMAARFHRCRLWRNDRSVSLCPDLGVELRSPELRQRSVRVLNTFDNFYDQEFVARLVADTGAGFPPPDDALCALSIPIGATSASCLVSGSQLPADPFDVGFYIYDATNSIQLPLVHLDVENDCDLDECFWRVTVTEESLQPAVEAVPEPSTLMLVSAPLALAMSRRLRKA
jgi:hypothetical protein